MSETGKSRINLNELAQPYEELTTEEVRNVRGGNLSAGSALPVLSSTQTPKPDEPPPSNGTGPGGTITGTLDPPGKHLQLEPPIKLP